MNSKKKKKTSTDRKKEITVNKHWRSVMDFFSVRLLFLSLSPLHIAHSFYLFCCYSFRIRRYKNIKIYHDFVDCLLIRKKYNANGVVFFVHPQFVFVKFTSGISLDSNEQQQN